MDGSATIFIRAHIEPALTAEESADVIGEISQGIGLGYAVTYDPPTSVLTYTMTTTDPEPHVDLMLQA